MRNSLKKLETSEIEKRIRNSMIYIFDCKKVFFVDAYVIAARMAREVFGVTNESVYHVIAVNAAKSYIDSHGTPSI